MKKGILIFIFLLLSMNLFADMNLYSIYRLYQRAMYLTENSSKKTLNFHTISADSVMESGKVGPWRSVKNSNKSAGDSKVQIIDPESWVSYNSAKPLGSNDGAVWQGKGINTSVTAGAKFSSEYLNIRLNPQFWFAQNSDFEIIATSSSSGYGDYAYHFDNLQRYGDSAYYSFSFGESEIRGYWKDLSMGLSNESIILGPGIENNLLLSSNAGGFPHVDVGTDGKIAIGKFGDLEVKGLWGVLKESPFYDDDSSNDYGWITGTYISVAPSFIPNFTIGLNYQYYKSLSNWDYRDIVRGITFLDNSNSPEDGRDVMASVPVTWSFPSAGFEFYAEWARTDYSPDFKHLLAEIEATQAVIIGLNQILYKSRDQIVMLSLEHTNISAWASDRSVWYWHSWAGWTQGYAYNGQIIGASIGPGSDSQTLGLRYYNTSGMWGVEVERIDHNRNYYKTLSGDVDRFVEINFGIERLLFLKDMTLYFNPLYSYILNNNYQSGEDISNLHFEFGVSHSF